MERPIDDAAWIATRRDAAIRSLRGAISATGLLRRRDAFGWTVRPALGSILASPRLAAWDPEPDYFHHWVRDAAIVIRVLPDILSAVVPEQAVWWEAAFHDHLRFSLMITDPARPGLPKNPLAPTTRPDHRQYLRPDADLETLTGRQRMFETRCSPDGTPDLERWSAAQLDGPALRASACLSVIEALPRLSSPDADILISRDLAHVRATAGHPCIGPWEEPEVARHTFTLIAQWDALLRGADWSRARGDLADAAEMTTVAGNVAELIQTAADTGSPAWKDSVEAPAGQFDSAVILAILQAGHGDGPLGLAAPRTLGTVAVLEAQFASLYAINRDRHPPAMGRSTRDAFFGGNPWYPVTLGFADLHYRIAALTGDRAAFRKADGWMATIRAVAPPEGALPEQFDRTSGAPRSCLELSWSAAAFIAAAAAREAACQVIARNSGL